MTAAAIICRLAFVLAATSLSMSARAGVTVEITGSPSVVYDSAHDGCGQDDMPDVNARAFRDAAGQVVMFALHDTNRALRGPDFAHLKVDCKTALPSPETGDPARYADRNFVTATWTQDGRTVAALVHHEYHADHFQRCRASGDLACWYNTIVGYRSEDGARSFARTVPFVVAAAPFKQDVDQGRQRGFFNPSNIVSERGHTYALISTTGWDGQPFGNCLFRTETPLRAGSWRAFDGRAFSIRYEDPYTTKNPAAKPCQAIAPFVFPVGSIVKHKPSGRWIALFQAKSGGLFPLDGFYYASSRDLVHWDDPKILLAGKTLYNDLCGAGPSIIAYPSMLDPTSSRRNFDEVGDHPDLFLASIEVVGCQTRHRLLVREQVTIKSDEKS